MKKCFKCNLRKSIEYFYKHSQMRDGHLNKCISCTKMDSSNRYNNPGSNKKIKAYDRMRSKTPERRAKKLEYQNRLRISNPGKYRARRMVGNAIHRQELKKRPCSVCNARIVEAHHVDYRQPFNIRWLCFKHHRAVHGQIVA